jgi:hypothetical protein
MVGIQEQRLKLKPICVLDWSSQCYAAALRYVTGILTSRCGHVWTMAWQCVVPGHLCGLGDYLTEKSLESPRPQEAWDSHGFVATDSMVSILRYSWCLSESIQTSASHDNNLAACRAQPERSVVWNSHSLNSVCVHWHFSMTSLDISSPLWQEMSATDVWHRSWCRSNQRSLLPLFLSPIAGPFQRSVWFGLSI